MVKEEERQEGDEELKLKLKPKLKQEQKDIEKWHSDYNHDFTSFIILDRTQIPPYRNYVSSLFTARSFIYMQFPNRSPNPELN